MTGLSGSVKNTTLPAQKLSSRLFFDPSFVLIHTHILTCQYAYISELLASQSLLASEVNGGDRPSSESKK